ncbi:MAG: alpha/beta hydrolase fold domain-containing protein [Dehalococcoidia bacterium]
MTPRHSASTPAGWRSRADSAGANLAAATLHDLVERLRITPFRAAVLAYGVFDFPATLRLPADTPFVNGETFAWQVEDYVGPETDIARLRDPRISPRYSPRLAGFPPSLLVVGDEDPLAPQSREFAGALNAAGVPAELHVYTSTPHAFLQIEALPACGEAFSAIDEFLTRTLGRRPAQRT